MALEILVDIFKRNLTLFVCPNPPAIPASTEHRTWLRQFQLDPGISRATLHRNAPPSFPWHSKHKLLLGGEEWLQNVSGKDPRPYLL